MFIALLLILLSIVLTVVQVRNRFKNTYIDKHKVKVKDDIKYAKYLKWCEINNEVPVDKLGFEDIRKREKDLYENLDRVGIKKID